MKLRQLDLPTAVVLVAIIGVVGWFLYQGRSIDALVTFLAYLAPSIVEKAQ